jgi:hypothetical protein
MIVISRNWSNWQNDIFNPRQILTDFGFGAVGGAIGHGGRQLFGKNLPQSASKSANIPNPNGRLGSSAHQAEVQKIEQIVLDLGYSPKTEFKIKSYRYADVAALDADEKLISLYQIGKGTQYSPIAREVRAINDIFEFSGYEVPIFFIPYN